VVRLLFVCQVRATRLAMQYIKACVVPLSKKDLIGVGKAADRAFDSRSCANLIKEGYQGVKRVIAKAAKQPVASEGSSSGAKASSADEWALTDAAAAACVHHRDLAPSLQLMAVGFDNLAPAYHAKIAKSAELGLNLHWLLTFADHVQQNRLLGGGSGGSGGGVGSNAISSKSSRKSSPDKGKSAAEDDRGRGRQRTRAGGAASGASGSYGGGMSGGTAPMRSGSRSVSQSTRFSVGSNDDESQDAY
jgi:hypothetical protein